MNETSSESDEEILASFVGLLLNNTHKDVLWVHSNMQILYFEIRKKLWKKGATPPKKTVFDKLEALERSEQHLVPAILWGVVIILGLYIIVKEASFANINLR